MTTAHAQQIICCFIAAPLFVLATLSESSPVHAEDGECTYSTQLTAPGQRELYTAQIRRIKNAATSAYGESQAENITFIFKGERIEIDQVSFDCIACHDGTSAPLHDIRFKGDTVRSGDISRVLGPHPIGMHYGSAAYAKPGTLRDQFSLHEDMVFVNGLVGCLSCHNPLNPAKKHLIMGLDQSQLCLTCHNK